MINISVMALALVTIAAACRQETVLNIFLESKTPPSFTFSGNASPSEFEVLELPLTKPLSKTNPFSFKGEPIWKVSVPEGVKADKWPPIRYGQIPNGFAQTVPDHGAPPKLSEDRLYVGRIGGGKESYSVVFFQIRNGKTVNVSDEVLGP